MYRRFEILKKLFLIFTISFLLVISIGCDETTNIDSNTLFQNLYPEEVETTTTTTTTTNITSTSELEDKPISITYPDYPNDDFFAYAYVHIWFNHSYPGYPQADREIIKDYYERENQEYFDLSNLSESGHFDNFYLSTYTPFTILTYKTKTGLFEDFQLLQTGLESNLFSQVTIELNTVGSSLQLTTQVSYEDLLYKTEKYFNTEIHYDSLNYEIIEESQNLLQLLGNQPLIISEYDQYTELIPSSFQWLTESFFENKALIYGYFGHSGSMNIQGVSDLFFNDENKLEVSVDFTASSNMMTCDYHPAYFLISVDKSIVSDNPDIVIRLHGTYANGYLFDRPRHNSIDS